ncbi:chemotaxis protein CheB [Deinococcus malanensis]|uniref:protein-glutamate methylesterase n=1 Tax=Deinococcus malanensis TaxID=1706855 RepID=A0ABQ2F2G3_9DEIO|nr:chemotaxis protein CheB [Deinococcus malanensis]GGK34079.1 chemotaxis protein CheB [Deinococcus malanensis]
MLSHWLVVVGASAGGIRPLIDLAANLPADFPAAICVTTHIPAYSPSHLPEILGRAGPLPASFAQDDEPIRPGRIYCAVPDHHLLIQDGCLSVKKGPKENRARPAVDTLFRSAAYSAGTGVIGVVLSGLLDDGTSGLWTIKEFGGIAVVQDPRDADHESMPTSALTQVEVDHTVRGQDLGALLVRLVAQAPEGTGRITVDQDTQHRVETEVKIALSDHAFRKGVMEFGKVTPQTCPECGGVLVQIKEGGFTRYRCHTGHAYTGDTLLVSVTEHVEETLWRTMRTMEEAVMLLENTGREFAEAGNGWLAEAYGRKARDLEERSTLMFRDVTENQRLSVDRLKDEA